MNQDEFVFTFSKILKRPPTLENIPEDVAEIIAAKIKDWAKLEGNLEQREMARRSRDSALRAVVLSSRKFHSLFLPILLQSVTVDESSILSLYHSLRRNPELGNSVQYLRFKESRDMSDEETESLCSSLASFSRVEAEDLDVQSYFGLLEVSKSIFEKLGSLQTLIVESPLAFPITFNLPSFTNSLKRLYIPYWEAANTWTYPPLNARNVIWLLKFGLFQEVSLSFTVSVFDFDFLSEHYRYFSATSKVRKLSLQYVFVQKESGQRTWWDRSGGTEKLKDRKTLALRMLLGITDRLECLELHPNHQGEGNLSGSVPLNLQCLSSLDGSFKTLRHLRLLSVITPDPIFNDYRDFRCLKSLSLDISMIFFLSHDPKLQLPMTLERIILTYYSGSSPQADSPEGFNEEGFLIKLLSAHSVQSLPNLKEVFVPSLAVTEDGNVYGSPEFSSHLVAWDKRKKLLESNAIFSDGKVRLRTYEPGEAVTSDAETFMSTLLWLSLLQL